MSVGAINEAYTRITSLNGSISCSFETNLDWNKCVCDVFKVSVMVKMPTYVVVVVVVVVVVDSSRAHYTSASSNAVHVPLHCEQLSLMLI